MADAVLVEPDTNAGMSWNWFRARSGAGMARSVATTLSASPQMGSATPSSPPNPSWPTQAPSTPMARPTSPTRASPSRRAPAAATDRSASTARGCSCPSAWIPRPTPVMGSYDENTVAAKATSAWYQLPPEDPGPPTGHGRGRRRHLVLRRRGPSSTTGSHSSCSGVCIAQTAASRPSTRCSPSM